MIIDTHTHIGRGEQLDDTWQIDQPASKLIAAMDEAGVDQSCVTAMAYEDYEYAIGELREAVETYPDRLIGFARVNLHREDQALEQVRRCFEDYGFRGLKIHHSLGDGFPTRRLMELLGGYGWPLLLHAPGDSGTIDAMVHLARSYPKVPVILGHMAGFSTSYPTFVKACALEAKRVPNLYLDTAFVYMYEWVKTAVEVCGAEKVLFASDGPIFHPALSRKVIELCHFSASEQAQILGGNAQRLLKLGGR